MTIEERVRQVRGIRKGLKFGTMFKLKNKMKGKIGKMRKFKKR